MKTLSLLLLVALCGCDHQATTNPNTVQQGPPAAINTGFTGFGWDSQNITQIVTNEGHVFMVAITRHGGIAVCEVTDASLVEKK